MSGPYRAGRTCSRGGRPVAPLEGRASDRRRHRSRPAREPGRAVRGGDTGSTAGPGLGLLSLTWQQRGAKGSSRTKSPGLASRGQLQKRRSGGRVTAGWALGRREGPGKGGVGGREQTGRRSCPARGAGGGGSRLSAGGLCLRSAQLDKGLAKQRPCPRAGRGPRDSSETSEKQRGDEGQGRAEVWTQGRGGADQGIVTTEQREGSGRGGEGPPLGQGLATPAARQSPGRSCWASDSSGQARPACWDAACTELGGRAARPRPSPAVLSLPGLRKLLRAPPPS